jgi:hypothetical protein
MNIGELRPSMELEFRESHEQMDRQEEQIAHELETILPANLHNHSGDSCQFANSPPARLTPP